MFEEPFDGRSTRRECIHQVEDIDVRSTHPLAVVFSTLQTAQFQQASLLVFIGGVVCQKAHHSLKEFVQHSLLGQL